MIKLKSIQSKMLFWIMVPLTLGLSLLFCLEYSFSTSKAYQDIKERSLNIAQMALHIVETDYANTDFVRLQQNLNEIGKQEKLKYIYVVDHNRLYVGHYPDTQKVKAPYFGALLEDDKKMEEKYLAHEIQYALPITNRFDGTMGALYVSYPLDQFLIQKKNMLSIRLGIVSILFLLLLLCVRFISKKFSNPIIELKRLSEEVASGNLDIQAKTLSSGDETQILTETFNHMVSEIKTSREKLIKKQKNLEENNRVLSLEVNKQNNFKMIGSSPKMKEVHNYIEKASPSDISVLITGETGCGKELVARAIHEHSSRAGKPFLPVNCGGFNINLIEAELFGHERGYFTGAHTTKPGKFETAKGGTLFFDEVGDMPIEFQVKLLRVLQEEKFLKVGGNNYITTDVRIISATNKDIPALIKEGKFRLDLYERINVLEIHLPSLKERENDIIDLIAHFLKIHRQKHKMEKLEISNSAVEILKNYPWPGNVRELENTMERLVALSDGEIIGIKDLAKDQKISTSIPSLSTGGSSPNVITVNNPNLRREDSDHETEIKAKILHALIKNNWNVNKTAKELYTNRQRVYRYIHKYNFKKMNPEYIEEKEVALQ